jgi:hypothetical protein
MLRFLLAALVAAPLLTNDLFADEVRLKDGRVLVGEVKTIGKVVEVQTLDGSERVAVDDVVRIRTKEELRADLMALEAAAGDTAFAHLQLARQARAYGLQEELWRHVDKMLPNDERLDGRVVEFLAGLEREILPARWRKSDVDTKVRELLFRIQPGTKPATRAAVVAVLSRLPDAGAALRRRARQSGQWAHRSAAVEALWLRSEEGNDRFVYRTLVVEGAPSVRATAADAIRRDGKVEAAAEYLAPGLLHESVTARVRTAHAIGLLPSALSVEKLALSGAEAARMPAAGGLQGGATRGHISITTQTSYIRDYDVEVAQASFIADPKVDVLQDGVVLDVTVLSVTSHRYMVIEGWRAAIRRLTNEDPGPNPELWADWLRAWRSKRAAAGAASRPTTTKS